MPRKFSGSAAETVRGVRSLAAAPDGAQERHGLGEGVLLSIETGDETAAADFAAGFERAADAGDVAPRHGRLLAGEGLAEDDAGTGEELAREEFRRSERPHPFPLPGERGRDASRGRRLQRPALTPPSRRFEAGTINQRSPP